jgi:hypothetical protein
VKGKIKLKVGIFGLVSTVGPQGVKTTRIWLQVDGWSPDAVRVTCRNRDLQKVGISKGDTVAIITTNGVDLVGAGRGMPRLRCKAKEIHHIPQQQAMTMGISPILFNK